MAKFLLGFKHMLSKHAIFLCKISTTFIADLLERCLNLIGDMYFFARLMC